MLHLDFVDSIPVPLMWTMLHDVYNLVALDKCCMRKEAQCMGDNEKNCRVPHFRLLNRNRIDTFQKRMMTGEGQWGGTKYMQAMIDGQTLNSQLFCQQLHRLKAAIGQLWPTGGNCISAGQRQTVYIESLVGKFLWIHFGSCTKW